jgi:hypothetical protein
MPSIIEGYTYDIFISYRQKDNKGDRLVSEFVEASIISRGSKKGCCRSKELTTFDEADVSREEYYSRPV